jgi:hypothetical protein
MLQVLLNEVRAGIPDAPESLIDAFKRQLSFDIQRSLQDQSQ